MVKDLYPGIDLVSYPDDKTQQPRYDLIVHPGADASQIKMRYTDTKDLHVDKDGQIAYSTPFGLVTEKQQTAIQTPTRARPTGFESLKSWAKMDWSISTSTATERTSRSSSTH